MFLNGFLDPAFYCDELFSLGSSSFCWGCLSELPFIKDSSSWISLIAFSASSSFSSAILMSIHLLLLATASSARYLQTSTILS